MTTTRKRARTDKGQFQGDDPSTPNVNEAWISTEDLASFIDYEGDKVKLGKAIKLSSAAAEAFIGRPLPPELNHNLAQGIKLLATKLLLTDKLDEQPTQADIPLVVRYYFQLEAA